MDPVARPPAAPPALAESVPRVATAAHRVCPRRPVVLSAHVAASTDAIRDPGDPRHSEVSRPGESHPQALAEPYMSVSTHTAPITQPPAAGPRGASGQTASAPDAQCRRAKVRRGDDV